MKNEKNTKELKDFIEDYGKSLKKMTPWWDVLNTVTSNWQRFLISYQLEKIYIELKKQNEK